MGGKGDYFSRRLFPCWLLVSLRRFDRGQQGTASLQAARVKALYATRLEQDKRVHEWRLPADAVGRYVRCVAAELWRGRSAAALSHSPSDPLLFRPTPYSVQLESETWLHFAELEVIGVPGVQRSPGPIAGVSCGHESMAVWTRSVEDPVCVPRCLAGARGACGPHRALRRTRRALEQQYLRAVRADVVHATILRTLETFFGCWELCVVARFPPGPHWE